MKIRRVVTGHTQDGKAIVTRDTDVDAVTLATAPGMEFCLLWGGDSPPTFPDDGSPRPSPSYFPPVGGFRFNVFTVPPQFETPVSPADFVKEAEEKLPGL